METEGNKRKLEDISKEVVVSEYDTCVHCKRRIDIYSDWEEPCKYHTGEYHNIIFIVSIMFAYLEAGKKVLNAEVWDEHTEWRTELVEGKIDDPAFGSGFKWTCCEEDGNHSGCQTGKHKGEKYPDAARKAPDEDEIEPGAKHQKVDESGSKSSSSVIDLTDEVEAPKAASVPSKAREVITVPDSSDVEEESEEEDSEADVESEFAETCTICGQEYYDNDEDQPECLSHDGMARCLIS
jgi:hypothetical protein